MESQATGTIYMLLGATASGKSAVAMEIAARLPVEIISLDSMQVYRGMDIGTAKPSPAERTSVRHHIIEVRDPWESFSTAEYVDLADAAVREVHARGALPLFVGGTVLYAKSLVSGIFEGPSADWPLRRRLRAEAETLGVQALHERLAEVDPASAERIHPNDLRRIERALEICEKTGRPASELRRQWEDGEARCDARIVGLDLPRRTLYKRINARVDAMIAAGWLDEVRRLKSDPRGLGREASQALGYGELARVLSGEIDLAEAVEEIKKLTRRFAKRQLTWLRSFPEITWVGVCAHDDAAALADKVIEAFGLADMRKSETRGGQ